MRRKERKKERKEERKKGRKEERKKKKKEIPLLSTDSIGICLIATIADLHSPFQT
jgi:hypothetical protein